VAPLGLGAPRMQGLRVQALSMTMVAPASHTFSLNEQQLAACNVPYLARLSGFVVWAQSLSCCSSKAGSCALAGAAFW
jgi:hypothetical protein